MGLTKVRDNSNMYPFITHLWNPIGGECQHRCQYCYVPDSMARLSGKYKGEPRLIKKELSTILGKGKTVFVGSHNDIFGEWILWEWLKQIMEHCNEYPGNTYFWQTKNPGRFAYWQKEQLFPKNSIFCTTIETDRDFPKLSYNLAFMVDRVNAMIELKGRKSVTIEPIVDFDLDTIVRWIKQIKPEWVSIGADSKRHNLPEPSADKVRELIWELGRFTRVVRKKNLKRLLEDK